MNNQVFIAIFIIVVFILGGFLYLNNPEPIEYINPEASNSKNKIVCTEEAKLCPDGSYVSREGPNCEFKECPTLHSQ